MLVYS